MIVCACGYTGKPQNLPVNNAIKGDTEVCPNCGDNSYDAYLVNKITEIPSDALLKKFKRESK